jgi:hypothetical protein
MCADETVVQWASPEDLSPSAGAPGGLPCVLFFKEALTGVHLLFVLFGPNGSARGVSL